MAACSVIFSPGWHVALAAPFLSLSRPQSYGPHTSNHVYGRGAYALL